VLFRILSIVFPVFAIVFVGWCYGRRRPLDMSAANALNLDVFTPMLVFSALATQHVALEHYASIALAGVVVVLGSGLLGWPLAHLFRQQKKTLLPTLMFNNSGNMGLPLTLLAFGEKAMPVAVVLFLIENVLHFSLGVWILDHHARFSDLWKIPLLVAGVVGIAVGQSGVTMWPPVITAVQMLAAICVPLMLFSLGMRLSDADWRGLCHGLLGGIACPMLGMLVAAACAPVFGLDREQAGILLVFGALPPAVLNYMFADRYQQEPDKVAAIVMAGNALSIIIVPIALLLALD